MSDLPEGWVHYKPRIPSLSARPRIYHPRRLQPPKHRSRTAHRAIADADPVYAESVTARLTVRYGSLSPVFQLFRLSASASALSQPAGCLPLAINN